MYYFPSCDVTMASKPQSSSPFPSCQAEMRALASFSYVSSLPLLASRGIGCNFMLLSIFFSISEILRKHEKLGEKKYNFLNLNSV
jgi:hypothetical protein